MTVPSSETLSMKLVDVPWDPAIRVRVGYLIFAMSEKLGRDALVVDYLNTPEKEMLRTPNFARKTLNMAHEAIEALTDGAYRKLWPTRHDLFLRRAAISTDYAMRWAELNGVTVKLTQDREEKHMTKGQYRVGINFNPSADDAVGRIKSMAAAMIDFIDGIEVPDSGFSVQAQEISRCKALAQTAIEDGAMWAVKAATKPPVS